MKMKIKLSMMLSLLIVFCVSLFAQDLKPISLPEPSFKNDKPLMQALKERKSSREFSDKELGLQDLANILWSANGINRPETGKRTIPSAMNKQDIDVYAVLKEGVYLYKADKHELVAVAAGDFRKFAGMQPFVASAPLNLLYVSDTSKYNMIKEREGILPIAAIGAGHCSQNVYLYGAVAGLAVVTRASLDMKKMTEVLKLKLQQVILFAQTVGYPK
jgi:SagB-type dehydrogenase family enzyme